MNSLWDASAPVTHQQQDSVPQQQHFQQPWLNPGLLGMRPPIYQQPYQANPLVQQDQAKVEVVAEEEKGEEEAVNEEVRATSNSMIEVLSKSADPKHRNSKFLKFLKKLAHGAYTVEQDQLVKQHDKLAEFKALEAQRLQEEAAR